MPPNISKKRKLGEGETKYYAVRAGKVPGVYMNWQEVQANVTGFKGANQKLFYSRKDAEDYVAGKNVSVPSDGQPEKFYGVAVGKVTGVYTDWGECQKQITDVKGPKYKKFPTHLEAEEWVRDYGKNITSKPTAKAVVEAKDEVKGDDKPSAKRVKVGASSKAVSSNGTSSNGVSSKVGSKGKLQIYTDGSSLGNGKLGASAGVGVYFGANDSRNVSERLQGNPQTNQRAELTAIIKALEKAPLDVDLEIITDSQYSIKCVTIWYRAWIRNNWMKSDGGNVINRDLVQEIRRLIEEREGLGREVTLTWVKGHSTDPGNIAADGLAVAGAQRS